MGSWAARICSRMRSSRRHPKSVSDLTARPTQMYRPPEGSKDVDEGGMPDEPRVAYVTLSVF